MSKFKNREEYEKWKAEKINNGSKEEKIENGGKTEEKEKSQKIKNILSRLDRKKLIFLALLIIIVILSGGYILYFKSPERLARNVVDKYLQSIMTGKGNPYETVDTLKVEKIFINVLAFEYLNTLKKEHVQADPLILDRNWYEENAKDLFNSYERFLQHEKKFYGDRAKETENGLIVGTNDYHYEFEFLYDVTLTNKLGQKLYKKYVFEVKPDSVKNFSHFHQMT